MVKRGPGGGLIEPHTREDGRIYVPACLCSHRSYDHAFVKPPGSPRWEGRGCRADGCGCTAFRPEDGSGWPHGVGP